ncbi:MAG: hypothetical protein O3C45_06480 [Bacteroidetes bacterium]|nr:hypothetical protein [Bacteroidota bacterium]MDA0874696.1 hypothetical protein [Bacteroidota bacterium]
MDHGKKDILLHLYGEASEATELRSLLRDEELRREHAALSEAKFRLDHLGRERPDPAVMDRILAAAAAGEGLPDGTSRRDRPPVARVVRLRRVMLPALTLAAAILFGVAVGWFSSQSGTSSPTDPAVATVQDDIVPPESLYRFVPPQQPFTPASAQDPRLAWDDSAPLLDMHRRIETMRPEGMLDWGEEAVPLESLPGSGNRSLRLAGTNN